MVAEYDTKVNLLSTQEISLYLGGCVMGFPIVHWLQHSFYPWLGIPVARIS